MQQQKPIRRKKAPLTPKQKLVKESAVQRERIERLVFVWQEKLFSHRRVSTQVLERATIYLQPKTFAEVVEERNVQDWCGYPLCSKMPQDLLKYKISLARQKVFDQSELSSYCTDQCFKKAKYYKMQLSEEPVWFRDLNSAPNAHIIPINQDFEAAIQQQRESKINKSSQEVKQQYVQQLLKNVPVKIDKETLPIIEKDAVEPQIAPEVTSFDTLEGYKIEIKKNGNTPVSMVLNKKPDKPTLPQEMADPTNEDDIFNTMMMLKDMNLDKPEESKASSSKAENHVGNADISTTETPAKVHTQGVSKKSTKSNIKELPEVEKSENDKVSNTPKQDKSKKKKKRVPELSLFGTIWTMLDHMTTKSTRIYLNDLENHQKRSDVMALLQEENIKLDETAILRGQILSERILETYHIIRAQLGFNESLEDDIMNVIRTFKLSDAFMVTPDAAQCYMLTLVIVKSLADITIRDVLWKESFEVCCKTIDQSLDMIDACVRVLKIASV